MRLWPHPIRARGRGWNTACYLYLSPLSLPLAHGSARNGGCGSCESACSLVSEWVMLWYLTGSLYSIHNFERVSLQYREPAVGYRLTSMLVALV